MATLRIYNEIADEDCKLFLQSTTGASSVSYKDISEFIAGINDDDKAIDIRLHCPGGSCIEGWAMYDALRRSGKEIHAVVEGECSSMATIILLAAPYECRAAYKNAHICIHNPAIESLNLDMYQRLTADKLELTAQEIMNQSKALRQEQEKILDLYVERTGASRKVLQELMRKESLMDADKAQELGFISQILVPTTAKRENNSSTNFNFHNMVKQEKKIVVKEGLFSRLLAKAGLARIEDLKIIDQIVTAADGRELTVEREFGDPQVGDIAYPDGSYVLTDGTTVQVENRCITNILPPLPITPLQQEVEEQATLKADLDNAKDTTEEEYEAQIDELRNKIASQYEAQISQQKDQIEKLNQTIASLQQTITELQQGAVSETDKEILNRVNQVGGKAWLDQVLSMHSTFNVNNRKFVDHTHPTDYQNESKTQQAIRKQRENAQAKRAKRD